MTEAQPVTPMQIVPVAEFETLALKPMMESAERAADQRRIGLQMKYAARFAWADLRYFLDVMSENGIVLARSAGGAEYSYDLTRDYYPE